MNELNKLVEYNNESFFEKIKRKILSFFKRKEKKEEENTDIYSNNIIIPNGVSKKEKKEFFELYEKIKNDEVNLDEIDDAVLYKVMIMLNEELSVNSRKIDDKMRMIEINIHNLKMGNSGLKLLNKN